jgi:peptidylprolyl isomerase
VRRLGVILLVLLVAVTGAVATALPASAGEAKTTLEDITVNGAFGEAPTLTYELPFSTKVSDHVDVSTGDGAKLEKGQRVSFDFAVFDGRTGETVESSFGSPAQSLILDSKESFPGLVKGLVGAPVGSRVLIAVAPKEGLTTRVTKPGVKKSDTLLFVVDVKGASEPLERAEGEAVAPVEGLPTVKLAKNGKPTIKSPKGDAPTELVVQPLITGTGPAVQAGQTVEVHYTGVLYGSDKKFDSSWDRKEPAAFPIGVGQVIAGWDEALVGQTVGSQVLLVVPPDKGYGAQGNPQGGISGTDTLVFVVDILDAY